MKLMIAIFLMMLMMLNMARSTKHLATIDPDAIQAIAFPAERTTFANGSAVPADLHVLCGFWDRDDRHANNPFAGSCDFVRADYGNATSLTCYASDVRLTIVASEITCAVDRETRSHGRPYVVQDSCHVKIHVHVCEMPPVWRTPALQSQMTETMYEQALWLYKRELDHQIVAHRSSLKPLTCRINVTEYIENARLLVQTFQRLRQEKISVSKALLIFASPHNSDKDAIALANFLGVTFAEGVLIVLSVVIGVLAGMLLFGLWRLCAFLPTVDELRYFIPFFLLMVFVVGLFAIIPIIEFRKMLS